MGNQIYDISLRNRSGESEFACKDGELSTAENVILTDGVGNNVFINDSGVKTDFERVQEIPVAGIEFGIVQGVLHGWHMAPDMYPSKTLSGKSTTIEYWNSVTPQLLSQFHTEAIGRGLFVAPFRVLAVWKSKDGAYLSPSSPILLSPNSEAPMIAASSDMIADEMELRVVGSVGSLYLKIRPDERLRDYAGRIKSLEILVSEPLHHYDTQNIMLPYKHISGEAYGEFLDPYNGTVTRRRICEDILPLAWKCKTFQKSNLENLSYYNFASIPLEEIDKLNSWQTAGAYICEAEIKETVKLTALSNSKKSESLTIKGKGENIEVYTRAIKLSGAGVLKRIKSISLRGHFKPSTLTIEVEASRDMLRWWKVARTIGNPILKMPFTCFRFFRIRITGILGSGETLEGFTFLSGV